MQLNIQHNMHSKKSLFHRRAVTNYHSHAAPFLAINYNSNTIRRKKRSESWALILV